MPIVRIQNLNGSGKPFNYFRGNLSNQVRVKGGDLLLAWSGTPGTSFGAHIWQGEAAILNQHIFRCDIDRSTITAEWAKFVINAQLDQLVDLAHGGVGLKHVTRGVVEDLEIPLPTLAEQERIAKVLDRAETLRDKRRSALAQLDTLTQSIFLDLFGDSATNPKGWQAKPLRDLVTEFRYGTSNKSATMGQPALRIPNVVGGTIDISDLKLVPVDPAELDRLRLIKGDVLFVRTNGNPDFVGRCAVFDDSVTVNSGFSSDEFIFASYLIRARLSARPVTPVFLREFMLGAEGRRQLRSRSKTSAGQFNINTENLGAISIPVPPQSLQEDFASCLGAVEKLKVGCRASLAELDALFAVLQHRAFRGEL